MRIFDEQGKLYPALLVVDVDGDQATAYAPGFDAIRVYNVDPLIIRQAEKMGYRILWV